jgi:short-subunit dehydrogenase
VGAAKGRGGPAWILNIASIVAFFPVPRFANYGGTKSYVRLFSEALSLELRGSGITVTCSCPGGTATEFSEHAGQELGTMARLALMSAERCARISVRAMLRGRRIVVTGLSNRLLCWLSAFVPRGLLGRIAGRVVGNEAPRQLPRAP